VDEPSVTLAQFPYQCEIDYDPRRWAETASAAFIAALGVPKEFKPNWIALSGGDEGARRARVGIAVYAIKKARAKDTHKSIFVSMAAFDASTNKILGHTSDLHPNPSYRHQDWFALLENNVGYLAIDGALEQKIRALAGRNVRPTAPSAGTPLAHDKKVFRIAMTANGAHIASVGWDARLRIWDAETGAATAAVSAGGGRMAFLHAVSIARGDKLLVTGPRKLTIYSIPDGTKVRELAGHPNGEVYDMCFSPSGKLIGSISYANYQGGDNSVALWDAATGQEMMRFKMKGLLGVHVAFSADDRRLFAWAVQWTTDDPDVLYAFDTKTGKLIAEEPLRAEVARNVAADFAATPAGLLAATWGAVFVLDENLKTKRIVAIPRLANPQVRAAFAPDGKQILVADDETVEVLELPSGKRRLELVSPVPGEVRRPAWSPAGDVILAAVETRIVRWNAKDGKPLAP